MYVFLLMGELALWLYLFFWLLDSHVCIKLKERGQELIFTNMLATMFTVAVVVFEATQYSL